MSQFATDNENTKIINILVSAELVGQNLKKILLNKIISEYKNISTIDVNNILNNFFDQNLVSNSKKDIFYKKDHVISINEKEFSLTIVRNGDTEFFFKDNEDSDQNFIKKDSVDNFKSAAEEIINAVNKELNETKSKLDGVRPQSNQARSLSSEVGGLEAKLSSNKEVVDVWDKRSQEIDQMEDQIVENLIDASSSSSRQSFVHKNKQKKKNEKKSAEAASESFEQMGYVQRIKNLKEDKSTIDNNRGGR